MNVTQLNALILKKDSNNRLYRGMKCFKEGLVLDIKSIADKEYGSLDIYGKVMSENDLNVYNTNLSFDLKKNELIYTECNCVDFENNCQRIPKDSYYWYRDEIKNNWEDLKK